MDQNDNLKKLVEFIECHMAGEEWFDDFSEHMAGFLNCGFDFLRKDDEGRLYIEAADTKIKIIYLPVNQWRDAIDQWLDGVSYSVCVSKLLDILLSFLVVATFMPNVSSADGKLFFEKGADIGYFDILKAIAIVKKNQKEGKRNDRP
jgi:hypothetical protein